MKKLLISLVAVAVCLPVSAKKKDIRWDFGAYAALSYNASFPLPERMVTSGLGLDLSLANLKFYAAPGTVLSVGFLNFMADFHYLRKGSMFLDNGIAVSAVHDARSKAHIGDFSFSFPVGITQKFYGYWAASLFVAPGVGFFSYNNDYIEGGTHHRNAFYPTTGRTGFRLDIKAAVWYQDVGLIVRYRPVAFRTAENGKMLQTVSFGIALRY